MNRAQHRSNNDVLRAPPGVPIEECSALAITRIRYPDGIDGVISYWQPTADELKRLNAGKPVALLVMGMTHPPVCMLVDGDGSLP